MLSSAHRVGGGEIMQFISAIISAVIANVVGHYICTWLDSTLNDDN